MRQTISHVALVVRDYDEAIAFFTRVMKEAFIGNQTGGRVTWQRSFLGAFAGQQRDPTDLMSPHFTFRDRTNPADSIRRGPGGVPGSGMDYVKALSERVSPIYAQAESMEVFQQRSGEVVVITRHPGVLPTVTRWVKQESEWKATSFVINVDDAALAGFSNSR